MPDASLSRPWPGGSARWSTTSTAGHPLRSVRRSGRITAPPVHAVASGRRQRRHQRHGGADPPGPLEHDVACVPRGHPLLLQRLVALVEHDDRGEVRAAAPTPRSGHRPRTARAAPGRRPRPRALHRLELRPQDEHPVPSPHEVAHQRAEPGALGHQHERRPVRREMRSATSSRRSAAGGQRDGLDREARARRGTGLGRARDRAPRWARWRRRKSATSLPAHRCAAQRPSSSSSAGGPAPTTLAIGSSRPAPGSGTTSSATTQPRTRRPCSGTRTTVPTRTSVPELRRGPRSRTRGRPRSDRADPRDPDRAHSTRDPPGGAPTVRRSADGRPRATAARRASAWAVLSHVNVGSLRPKWP